MKHYNEIVLELQSISDEIEKSEEEEVRLYEKWATIKEPIKQKECYQSLAEKINESYQRTIDLKIAKNILQKNANIALYFDVLPVALEFLRKHVGEHFMSLEKELNKHVFKETGADAIINLDNFGTIHIRYSAYGDHPVCSEVKCVPKPNVICENQKRLLDYFGRINSLSFDDFCVFGFENAYTENVPEAVEELKRLRALASKKQDELVKVCKEYNAIACRGLYISSRETIAEHFDYLRSRYAPHPQNHP